MPLVGQGIEGFGQQRELLHVATDLAGAGGKHGAGDADEIPEIDQPLPQHIIGFFADAVALDVDLDPPAAVLDMGEAGLAHHAHGHEPAG